MTDSQPSTKRASTRRDFVKSAAGLLAVGAAGNALLPRVAPQARAAPPRAKTKIRIGTRINNAWLNSTNDDDLRYLKQIGVDSVDVTMGIIDGYDGTGSVTRDDFRRFVDRIGDLGLKIERANSLGGYYLNAFLDRPEGQREIDNLKRIGEILVEHDIPVFGIQACQASRLYGHPRQPWSRPTRRGGYQTYHFDEKSVRGETKPPKQKVTAEQLWRGITNIYSQVMPVVDGSKTRIAMHGNDPPLHNYLGNPQILCRFADLDRLMAAVPSANNGVTFCVGTRYESGEDIFAGIRHFGSQGKLFHVHFRNVIGTLPKNEAYSEVFVDDGDIDMPRVAKALNDVGYDGVIDYDHPMPIVGDEPLPKQYIAFAVGYMRGILQSL